MKSNFKLLQQSMLFCLLGLSIILTSCAKEQDLNKETNELLCGDWEVTSLTVNGGEYIGSVLTKFDMEFKCETDFGGEAEWSLFPINGTPIFLEEDYEIKLDGRELEFGDDDFDLDLNEDRLELNGNIGGERWEIEAKRD